MNIHWLQHVDFEGLGCIEPWLAENGHDVSCTRLWAGDPLPQLAGKGCHSFQSLPHNNAAFLPPVESLYSKSLCSSAKREHTRSRVREACPTTLSDIDGLIVMGGPMGIDDEKQYPWLAAEKAFIKEIIDQNKPVLGICLGAQLIADVLGSRVWKNEHKEIGFFPISGSPKHEISNDWKNQTVFHWHGDTFGIPDGAVRLASSEAAENQAFLYKDNVLALQFHLETTEESLLALYKNAADEMIDAPFIQILEEMRPFFPMLGNANALMNDLLKRLFL